ncbi:MAG: hypothetical protein RSB77_01180 [Bacilli bacterium]
MKKLGNIIIIISIILFGLTFYIYKTKYATFKKYEYKKNADAAIYYKLNEISKIYFKMQNNRYLVWNKAKEKNLTVEYISSITKIEQKKLNNKYCLKIKNSPKNTIKCIDEYYKNEDVEQFIQAEISEINMLLPLTLSGDVESRSQTVLYLFEDMKRLKVDINGDDNKFYQKFKEIKNELENELTDIRKKIV